VTITSSEMPTRSRGLPPTLRISATRDELFAGLCILACANGLWGRVIMAVREGGWQGAVFNLDISAFVLFACVGAVWLLLHDKSGEVRRREVAVAVALVIFVILPIPALGWVALTGLSLYILLFSSGSSSRKRGAILMLAITVPMLWVPLLVQFFEQPILQFDAALVACLIGSQHTGDMVAFRHGSGYVQIAPPCSSITNVALAFLCWVGVTQWANRRFSVEDILWAVLVCSSAVAVNVLRIGLVAQSHEYYEVFHNQYWDLTSMVANILTMAAAIGLSVLGARRELLSRA
jgi:exosortase/archaeosortase family protein